MGDYSAPPATSTTYTGTDDISVSGSTIRRVQQATAGDYLLLPTPIGTIGTANVNPANQVRVYRFRHNARLLVTRLAFAIATASSGGFASVGLYNADGTTLLIDSGPQSTTSGGTLELENPADYDLVPGTYILAWTADNVTATLRTMALDANLATLINAGEVEIGTAANASTAGQLPGTLGALTGANVAIATVKLMAAAS